MSNNLTAEQLLKRSLDTFLAKDMKGWADLCARMLSSSSLLRQMQHPEKLWDVQPSMNI